MSTEAWKRVDAIFDGALTRSPDERAAFLDEACGDDEELRRRVEGLLEAAEVGDSFLDGIAPGVRMDADARPDAAGTGEGHEIGPYRLVELVGEGGMGAVYRADRVDGQFEQQVAIKLVHPSHVRGKALVRRFLQERQILARLQHPHIARLYDGGVTADGRPWLAMEYVDGVPITRYCDQASLDVRGRIALFADVGRAVRYAHGQLVIHRDLKPTNILVDGGGQVKLLDFGIAKLLEPDAEVTATRTGGRLLTPAYAAPEQIRGESVTTATDVYQLGVLLYELLSGERPHQTADRTPFEIERSICEDEPPKPSRQASDSAADTRATDRITLERTLSGDLDTITLKAMEKDPSRRYAGAGELVDDVQRHLAGLPVSARPATVRYRVAKFVARHRVGVAAGLLFVITLAGYAVTVTAQARQIAVERDRARIEAARAEQVTTVFAELFENADPFRDSAGDGEEVTVRAALAQGAVRVREELVDQPEVQARLLGVIGMVYLNMGSYDEAEPLLREALAAYEAMGAPLDAARGEITSDLAHLLQETGEVEESEALFRRALQIQREVLPPSDPALAITLTRFGGLLWFNVGDFAGADSVFREALAIRRAALEPDDPVLTTSLNSMANLLHSQGDYAGAEPFYREAIEGYRRQLGEHPNLAIVQSNFAALLRDKGDYDEAETVQREALALHRRTQGDRNIDVALGLGSLGSILLEQGRWAEADSALAAGLEQQIEIFGADHPYSLRTRMYVVRLRTAQGRFDEARASLLGLREGYASAFPAGHFAHAEPVLALGRLDLRTGRPDAALSLIREGLRIREEAYGEGHWQVAEARSLLGEALTAAGALEEAEQLLTQALQALESDRGDDDPYVREALRRLVELHEAQNAPEAAAPYRDRLAAAG